MAGKKSATALAAQREYFEKNGIVFDKKDKKDKKDKVVKKNTAISFNNVNLKNNLDEKGFGIYIRNINKWHPTGTKLNVMQDKDILKLLIDNYKDKLSFIKSKTIEDNYFNVHENICKSDFAFGICNTSYSLHGVSISDKQFVLDNKTNGSHYWCTIPFECYNFEELIKSFEFRIKKMSEILNSILYE